MSTQAGSIDIAAIEAMMRAVMKQERLPAGATVNRTSEERRCAEMASMGFTAASELWLSYHQMHLKKSTLRSYRMNLRPLQNFFAQTPLIDIGLNEIRRYQNWRRKTAGAVRTNADVGILQQILRDANLWHPLANLYKPCRVVQRKVRQA
jgi:hypothetical protein